MVYNPLDLSGRRYLVTGAASGMGRATALYLSSLGAELLLVDINREESARTASECSTECVVLDIDLSAVSSLSSEVTAFAAQRGKVHGIVHCAGIPYVTPLKAINREKSEKVMAVNAMAALDLAKIFANKRVYAGEHGSIVLISSVYGLVGSSANAAYAMSKGAVQSLTKALAIELAPKGIRVNCIAPGFVKTAMADGINKNFEEGYQERIEQMHPLGWGEPQDIAAGVAYLLSDMAKWVTGTILSIDGGFTAQ